jgi:hypothetical protein
MMLTIHLIAEYWPALQAFAISFELHENVRHTQTNQVLVQLEYPLILSL